VPDPGIGFETALLFAQEGANVVLADINLATVESVAALIKERSPRVIGLPVESNVSKEVEVKAMVDAALLEFDVMFNNAGILTFSGR